MLSNMLPTIEHHVDWISECLCYLREGRVTVIEADLDAQDAQVEHEIKLQREPFDMPVVLGTFSTKRAG